MEMATKLFAVFIAALVIEAGALFVHAEEPARRAELEHQLEQYEREAAELDAILQKVQGEGHTLANEKKQIEIEIRRRALEIKRLDIIIRTTQGQIQEKTATIEVLKKKIGRSRESLAAGLLVLSTYDREGAFLLLVKNANLSDFFSSLHGLEPIQLNLQEALGEFKEDKELLEKERGELEEVKEEQQELKALQEVERRFLAQKKKEKDELLRLTQGKEAIFQKLLQSKKKDIASLRTQLFYLEKTGITAEEAVRLADLAARRAGIRTSFLLALLEVETGKQFEDGVISVGTNLGTGTWKTDMYDCYIRLKKRTVAEAEKSAFFALTGALGLDPDRMPVSRKPNYGCGGAMGPAQFLPTTWRRFESRVGTLTGHVPPNPWNPEDAFTAAAVFLASAGADLQTPAGETTAAKTYLSGNPRCAKSICRYYSNRILALAKEIDRTL